MNIREQTERINACIEHMESLDIAELDAIVTSGSDEPSECRPELTDCSRIIASELEFGDVIVLCSMVSVDPMRPGKFVCIALPDDMQHAECPMVALVRVRPEHRALANLGQENEDVVLKLFADLEPNHPIGIPMGLLANIPGDTYVIALSPNEANIIIADAEQQQGKLQQAQAADPMMQALSATAKSSDDKDRVHAAYNQLIHLYPSPAEYHRLNNKDPSVVPLTPAPANKLSLTTTMDRVNTFFSTTVDSSISGTALQFTVKQVVSLLSFSFGSGPHQISSVIFVKSEDKTKPDTPIQRAANAKKAFLPVLSHLFGDPFITSALASLLDEIDDKLHPADGNEFSDLFDYFVARIKTASSDADRASQATFRAWVINTALKIDLNDAKIREHLRAKQEKINKNLQDQLYAAAAVTAAANKRRPDNPPGGRGAGGRAAPGRGSGGRGPGGRVPGGRGDSDRVTGFKRQRDSEFETTVTAYKLTRPLQIPAGQLEFCRNVAKGEVCGKHAKGTCPDDHDQRAWHTAPYKAWLAAFPRFVPPAAAPQVAAAH